MLDIQMLRRTNLKDMIDAYKVGDLPLLRLGILPRDEDVGTHHAWDIQRPARDVGTFEGPFSPAGTRKMEVIGHQSANLIRTFKSTFIPGNVLLDLRREGGEDRERAAERRVAKETLSLRRLLDRQDEYMISRSLHGALAVTIDGMAHAIDYKFSDSHKFENGKVGADIPVSWDDPGADLIEDIKNIKKRVAEDSGYTLRTVMVGSDVIAAILKNDVITNLIAGSAMAEEYARSGMIREFQGLSWIVNDATYKPDGGAVTYYIDRDKAIFLPEPSEEIGYFRVGSEMVQDDDERGMSEVVGRFAFTRTKYNPASLELFAGEVRMPVIRIPDALATAKVLF